MTLGAVATVWEVWTILSRTKGDTFSATIRKIAEAQPVVVIFAGLLMRHLFKEQSHIFLMAYGLGEFWPCIDKEEIQEVVESK